MKLAWLKGVLVRLKVWRCSLLVPFWDKRADNVDRNWYWESGKCTFSRGIFFLYREIEEKLHRFCISPVLFQIRILIFSSFIKIWLKSDVEWPSGSSRRTLGNRRSQAIPQIRRARKHICMCNKTINGCRVYSQIELMMSWRTLRYISHRVRLNMNIQVDCQYCTVPVIKI